MKKLMVTVATLALAVVVNAATVKWSTGYEIGNGTSSGYTAASLVYLIDASVLTQSSIYSGVVGGKTLAATIGEKSIASATLSDGMISDQTLTVSTSGDATYYMVLFDSSLGENGALYFSEQQKNTLSPVGAAVYSFSSDSSIAAVAANMTGFSASDGGWVAVPEPTSGLLLVLGMAGLMLRRRRA